MRVLPNPVRSFARALAVQFGQIFPSRRLNPGGFRQLHQKLFIPLLAVPAHDAAQRCIRFQRGLSLQPSLEAGLRRDGGDAETGAGVDIGGGLIVSDAATGLSANVRVRMLLVHQDQGFRDRGVSLSFGYNPAPSAPFGFMAKVTPSWGGQATSDAEALWGRETMAGMADGGPAAGGRLEAELRHRGLRARARLPAGLRPDGGAGRRYAFRSRCLRQSPREFGPGGRGARPWRPAHRALVEMAPRLLPPALFARSSKV